MAGRPAWAVSFADLALLLVAFFVLLHAGAGREVAAGARAAFAGAAQDAPLFDAAAGAIFEAGEARLLPGARAELRRIGAGAGDLVVASEGAVAGARRFDAWELSAARAAAVARALVEGGAREEKIRIAMPPQGASRAGGGQRLTVSAGR